jgi:rod shape-determining protein MreC
MARTGSSEQDYVTPIRRLLVAVVVLALLGLFLVWRIDSPRVERLRAQISDAVVTRMEWAMVPLTGMARIAADFQSYQRIYQQNQELRRELRQMQAWREAALQLEQENARLLDLNKVRVDPQLTFVTGVVLADSGSPFRQSVLLNVGARDGIVDGWAAMDGLGLVGRISGVGQRTSRVLLLTDAASRLPVVIQPSGQTALVMGDNSSAPPLAFIENPELVRPGDRVVSSGDGGVFPAGLLVGQVTEGPDRRLRLRPAADYERLEFLRVLRFQPTERLDDPGSLLLPGGPGVPPIPLAPNAGEAPAAPVAANVGSGNG